MRSELQTAEIQVIFDRVSTWKETSTLNNRLSFEKITKIYELIVDNDAPPPYEDPTLTRNHEPRRIGVLPDDKIYYNPTWPTDRDYINEILPLGPEQGHIEPNFFWKGPFQKYISLVQAGENNNPQLDNLVRRLSQVPTLQTKADSSENPIESPIQTVDQAPVEPELDDSNSH